jgi:hypothetical protein
MKLQIKYFIKPIALINLLLLNLLFMDLVVLEPNKLEDDYLLVEKRATLSRRIGSEIYILVTKAGREFRVPANTTLAPDSGTTIKINIARIYRVPLTITYQQNGQLQALDMNPFLKNTVVLVFFLLVLVITIFFLVSKINDEIKEDFFLFLSICFYISLAVIVYW